MNPKWYFVLSNHFCIEFIVFALGRPQSFQFRCLVDSGIKFTV